MAKSSTAPVRGVGDPCCAILARVGVLVLRDEEGAERDAVLRVGVAMFTLRRSG